MSGSDKTTKEETKQTVSAPWAPAQPLLGSILGSLGGLSTGVTPEQQAAIAALFGGATAVPNFGGAGAGAVGNAFGTSTSPQQGLLSGAFGDLTRNLSPYASGANLDPFTNPAMKGILDTTRNDITNQIRSQFAAAGRSDSPAETTALARGLSQGEAGLLANQYNQNLANMFGANNALFGGAGSTAGGLTSQQLAALNAQLGGIQAAGALPGLYTAPGSTLLGAANAAYGLPYQNIGLLSGMVNPIAQLGGTTNATGTSTTTIPQSTWGNIIGAGLGIGGLLGSWLGSGFLNPNNANYLFK